MSRIIVEVAVDSLVAAVAAAGLGADRLELCDRLDLDGLTPSVELLEAIQTAVRTPVFVMIRSRAGDFHYDAAELATMRQSVRKLARVGAAGFVIGALDSSGGIDQSAVSAVVGETEGRPVTFHRAFDQVRAMVPAVHQLRSLGVTRVLTSGGAETAYQGRRMLSELVRAAPNGLSVLGGGGIRGDQVEALIRETGLEEIHLAGVTRGAGAGVPDAARLRALFDALAPRT